MKLAILTFALFCLWVHTLPGQTYVPKNKIVDWTQCGLEQKINTSSWPVVNLSTYGTPANTTAAFTNLFTLVTPPVIIQVGAGDYYISSAIYLPSHVVVRGAGPGITRFHINNPSGAEFRDGFRLQGKPDRMRGDCRLTSDENTITTSVTGPLFKDSYTVTVSNGAYFSLGDNIEIEQENNATEITDDVDWAAYAKGQLAVITAISGNTLTLDRSLTQNYTGNIRVRKFEPVVNIGLENFTIQNDAASYNSNIGLEWAANCWIRNIESKMADRDHIRVDRSRNIEISNCYVHDAHSYGAGGFGYGLRLSDHTCESLVENNIMKHLRHGIIIKEGATRNVYGYNYVREGFYSDGNHFPADISIHGHWANMNLFEGNIVGRITISDAWGRTGPGNLLFRNRSERSWHISVEELSHDQILVGNEILEPYLRRSDGTYFCGSNCATEAPGYCNQSWCGGMAPYYGDCVMRNCYPSPNPEYIHIEIEPGILNTLRYSNKNYFGFMDANLALPKSHYQCTKPAFFAVGDAWPSIGPEWTNGAGTIPARKRWAAYASSGNLMDLFDPCSGASAVPTPITPAEVSTCSPGTLQIPTGLSVAGHTFEWYKNGIVLPAATGPSLTFTDSAWYGVRVLKSGCYYTSCTQVSKKISVNLGPDLVLCQPSHEWLKPQVNGQFLSYSWSTGSTKDSILVNQPGTYTVTVSSPSCAPVSDAVTVTTKNLKPINASLPCGGGTATLGVGDGKIALWYTTPTGGSAFHTGNSLTQNFASTTTYWLEEAGANHQFTIGPLINDLVPAYTPASRNPNDLDGGKTKYKMVFTTTRVLVLQSVDIYIEATNLSPFTVKLQVEDKDGNILPGTTVTGTYTVPATGFRSLTIPMNITLPVGKDLALTARGSSSGTLKWQFFEDGGNYPYQDPNQLMSITRSDYTYCTNLKDPVAYFFNWKVKLPDALCDRVPVVAEIFCNPPLPLEILYLNAFRESSTEVQIQAFWKPQANVYALSLERSVDGIHFESIFTVAQAHFSPSFQHFDTQAPNRLLYYRLSCFYTDGHVEHSNVIPVAPALNLRIYPNPFTGSFMLEMFDDQDNTYTYTLRDLSGKALEQGTAQNDTPLGATLSQGVYILEIEGRNWKSAHKVIKMK